MVGPGFMQSMDMEMGQFAPNQNIRSFEEATAFQRLQMTVGSAAIQAHAPADLNAIFSGLRGMGLFADGDSRVQQNMLAHKMASIAPWLNMAQPGMADVLGPGMGSAAFAGSMANVFRPVMQGAGGMGTAAVQNHIAGITGGMHAQFAGGRTMMGMRIGQIGGAINIAQNMGLGASQEQLRTMSTQDLAAGFTKLGRGLAHPLSAVRDMGEQFAGLSQPQQFAAAQALTMGGFQHDTMQEMGMDIRTFRALAQSSAVSTGTGMGLMSIAGQRSMEMGGERHLGGLAGRHAIAMAGAVGGISGIDKNLVAQKDALLTAQAGNSTAAAQMAATMQLGEAGLLDEGSRGHQEYLAIKSGGGTFMAPADWRKMMAEAGVDPGTASTIMHDRVGNLAKFGEKVASRAREMQFDQDIGSRMIRNIKGRLSGAARRSGGSMTTAQAMKAAQDMTMIMRNSADMDDDELMDALKAKMREMGMNEKEATSAALMGMGAGETVSRQMGATNLREMAALHGHKQLAAVRRLRAEARGEAGAAARAAGRGQGGPLERAVGGIKDAEKGLLRFIARIMGGEPADGSSPETDSLETDERARDADSSRPSDGGPDEEIPPLAVTDIQTAIEGQTSPGELGPVPQGVDSGEIPV